MAAMEEALKIDG